MDPTRRNPITKTNLNNPPNMCFIFTPPFPQMQLEKLIEYR
jgi:hypothetical protein